MIGLTTFKRKIIMNIFLKKIIKKNHPLGLYYHNQYHKILIYQISNLLIQINQL